MSDSLALQNRIPTELIARAKAVVGLLTVAIVHILDLHDTLEETPLLGYGAPCSPTSSAGPPASRATPTTSATGAARSAPRPSAPRPPPSCWLADAPVAPASPHGTARRRAGRGGFRPLLELHALISSHQFTCESNGALPCPATCLRASPGGVSSPPPH